MKTGFENLDKHIGGFIDGEIIVLGGRPAMGKTSFAIDIARNCKRTVLYFSLETIQVQHLKQFEGHNICLSEYYPTDVDTERRIEPFGEINEIRKRIVPQKNDIDLIIIDYIQLLDTKQPLKELKALAQEINKPILALSQLSRHNTSYPIYRPDNLRIDKEQIAYADKILILDRSCYYDMDTLFPNIAEVIAYTNPFKIQQRVYLCYELVDDVLNFFDNSEDDVTIALRFMQLTQCQFAEGNDETYMKTFTKLRNMALKWSGSEETIFLTSHAFCCDCKDNNDHLLRRFGELVEQALNDEILAEAAARGLAHFSPQTSNSDILVEIRKHLKRLNTKYPYNVAIASNYADGLFYLAECLRESNSVCIYTEAIEELNTLAKNYPDEVSIIGCAECFAEEIEAEQMKNDYTNTVLTYGLTTEENDLLKKQHTEFEFNDVSDCFTDLLAFNSVAMIMNPEKLSLDELEQLVSVYCFDCSSLFIFTSEEKKLDGKIPNSAVCEIPYKREMARLLNLAKNYLHNDENAEELPLLSCDDIHNERVKRNAPRMD